MTSCKIPRPVNGIDYPQPTDLAHARIVFRSRFLGKKLRSRIFLFDLLYEERLHLKIRLRCKISTFFCMYCEISALEILPRNPPRFFNKPTYKFPRLGQIYRTRRIHTCSAYKMQAQMLNA